MNEIEMAFTKYQPSCLTLKSIVNADCDCLRNQSHELILNAIVSFTG